MPILAHVNAENSFLHTLSVTDGKNFDFCTRSRLRTEKNSRPPAATSKEIKLCIFPITDGTKNRFWHTLSVTEEKKSTRAFYFFGARHCRPALGRCPPQSDRDKSATEKEDARTRFFFPAVLAYTFSSSPVEIRKGRIPILSVCFTLFWRFSSV